MGSRTFERFGHRGAAGHAPENTLRAVARGLELGATGIEIDVHLVGEELVVMHDDTLERTTNGSGSLRNVSLDYLRSLDAGEGERVPLLAEVYELVVGRARLNIELKGPGTAGAVARFIGGSVGAGRGRFDDLLVSSFDHRELAELQRLAPAIPRAPLLYGIPHDLAACATSLGACAVHVSVEFLSAELIADAHRRGVKVFVYTVNEREVIEALYERGIDGVFSDFPERASGF